MTTYAHREVERYAFEGRTISCTSFLALIMASCITLIVKDGADDADDDLEDEACFELRTTMSKSREGLLGCITIQTKRRKKQVNIFFSEKVHTNKRQIV